MQETGNSLIREFTEKYMETLFYFCLKKTGNPADAEDLTQDIALNILHALRKGTVPVSFSGWVWQIARNRYALWADKKHKHTQTVTGSDVYDYDIANENGDILDEMMHAEQLALLRRELAFIKQDYRQILVAYYIENKRIAEIAENLSISLSAAQQRLHRARKILKEGMDMAREFGKLSYKPENIGFVASGPQPTGLPWRAVQRMLPVNILIYASNNPVTLEELSMELGIALPYMEEEVQMLCQATLLEKQGDKYITNIFILDKDCRLAVYNALRSNAKVRSQFIQEFLTDEIQAIRDLGIAGAHLDDNHIRWWLVPYLIDNLVSSAPTDENLFARPKRANGEAWGFIGYEVADIPPDGFVMGKNGVGDNFSHFYAYEMWNRPVLMTWEGVMLMGECLRNDRRITDFSNSEKRLWLEIDGKSAHADAEGRIIPDIPVVSNKQLEQIFTLLRNHKNYDTFMQNGLDVYQKLKGILKEYSHAVLHRQLGYHIKMEMCGMRGMAVYDLAVNGFLQLPADPNKSTLGMYFILNEVK